jgi:hypothetical protein
MIEKRTKTRETDRQTDIEKERAAPHHTMCTKREQGEVDPKAKRCAQGEQMVTIKAKEM